MNNFAVVGDPELCGHIREALAKQIGMAVLSNEDLELEDEYSAKRWFCRNEPTGAFVCMGLKGQTSVAEFSFTIGGTLNAIRAAVGNVYCLLVITAFPTAEFFLMARLAELYRREKGLVFLNVMRNTTDTPDTFAHRCVLRMRGVLAQKEDTNGSKGSEQGGEVREQMVPQSAGGQQHGTAPAAVLEVPVKAAAGTASGDLRAQCAPAESEGPSNTLFANSGTV